MKSECTKITRIPFLLSAVVFSCWELFSFEQGKNINNSKDRDSDYFLTCFCVFIRFHPKSQFQNTRDDSYMTLKQTKGMFTLAHLGCQSPESNTWEFFRAQNAFAVLPKKRKTNRKNKQTNKKKPDVLRLRGFLCEPPIKASFVDTLAPHWRRS